MAAGNIVGTIEDLLKGKDILGHQTGDDRKVSIVSIKPLARNKQLVIKALANGTSLYDLTYIISNIGFSDTKDSDHPLTVNLGQGVYIYCSQATLKNPVQVRCTCPDFYYTWSHWDAINKNLAGPRMKPYVRKTTTYPERNAEHVVGMCKHLIKLTARLRQERIIK